MNRSDRLVGNRLALAGTVIYFLVRVAAFIRTRLDIDVLGHLGWLTSGRCASAETTVP